MSVRQTAGALELQASEAVVVHAASRILAALIRNGRLTDGNHTALLRFAVRMAFELAREADRSVQSDGEPAARSDVASRSRSRRGAGSAQQRRHPRSARLTGCGPNTRTGTCGSACGRSRRDQSAPYFARQRRSSRAARWASSTSIQSGSR